jgi:tetratricopeptide (TPR) repeat protein
MNDRARAKSSFDRAMSLLRAGDAPGAERICRAALEDFPRDTNILSLLAATLRKQRRLAEAESVLHDVLARSPGHAKAHEEMGTVLLLAGRGREACGYLERALALEPRLRSAQLKLSSAIAQTGEAERARATLDAVLQSDPTLKALADAAEHVAAGRLSEAERLYVHVLGGQPDHVDALRGLGNVALRLQHYRDAAALLGRVVRLAPDFAAAWGELAHAQLEQDEHEQALASIQRALRLDPDTAAHRLTLGNVLARSGRHEEAIAAFEQAIALQPERPALHLALGNALRTIGRHDEAVAAYRRSIALRSDYAEGYWSLSNLKTFRFSSEEVAAMEMHVAREGLPAEALVHFSFALGQAYESRGEYDRAFAAWARGNAERRTREQYDPVHTENINARIIDVFTREFLARRAGLGDPDPAPILIVGLPRAGSTLIEQILASHSLVEGTHELPSLPRVVQAINRQRDDGIAYPEALVDLPPEGWAHLGRRYLEHTRRYRTEAPRFIDKMPNNFANVGLVHLMLPNARIIDARRDARDTCVSAFKQLFAQGQPFTYDLFELGEYYLQYLRMMEHWDRVLPGLVLHVRYEDVIADLEGQARRIVSHCGLPWEENCLRFHETARAVRTASSEQVRRPIYTGSIGAWRRYAHHVEPLLATLGAAAQDDVAREGGDAAAQRSNR